MDTDVLKYAAVSQAEEVEKSAKLQPTTTHGWLFILAGSKGNVISSHEKKFRMH